MTAAAGAARRAGTGTPATRVLGLVTLAALAATALFGLVLSPPDSLQGDATRIMYIHVPSAWLAYAAFFVTFVASVLFLVPKTRSLAWDRVAGASAEVGVVFTGLCLATGMLWGRPIWGVYWTWDARLTTTAMLFLLYVGYLVLRRIPGTLEGRAKRAAVVGIVAFANVPLVHYSVRLFRTLHQGQSVATGQLQDLMLFSLFLGLVSFTLLYVWLVIHRYRVAWLEDRVEQVALERAIVARAAEADDPPEATPPAEAARSGPVVAAGTEGSGP